MQCTYSGIVGMPIVGIWAFSIWVELLQGRTQGGVYVGAPAPPFWSAKSKGKKIQNLCDKFSKMSNFLVKK